MTAGVGRTSPTIFTAQNFLDAASITLDGCMAVGLKQIARLRELRLPIHGTTLTRARLFTDFIHYLSAYFAAKTSLEIVAKTYRKLTGREVNVLAGASLVVSAAGLYTGATWTRVAFLAAHGLFDNIDNANPSVGWPEVSAWDHSFVQAGLLYGYSVYLGGFTNQAAAVASLVCKTVAGLSAAKGTLEMITISHEIPDLASDIRDRVLSCLPSRT